MSNKYRITDTDNKKLEKYKEKWEKMSGEERSNIKRIANKVNIMTEKDYNHFKVLLSSLKLKGIHARSMIDVEIMRILDSYYNYDANKSNRFYDVYFIDVAEDKIRVSKAKSGVCKISKYLNSADFNNDNLICNTQDILSQVHSEATSVVDLDMNEINLYELEDIYCDEIDLREFGEEKEKGLSFQELDAKFEKWRSYDNKAHIFTNEVEYKTFFTDYLYEIYNLDINSIIIRENGKYYTTTDVIQGYNDSNYIFNHRTVVKTVRDEDGVLYRNYLGIRVREFTLSPALV